MHLDTFFAIFIGIYAIFGWKNGVLVSASKPINWIGAGIVGLLVWPYTKELVFDVGSVSTAVEQLPSALDSLGGGKQITVLPSSLSSLGKTLKTHGASIALIGCMLAAFVATMVLNNLTIRPVLKMFKVGFIGRVLGAAFSAFYGLFLLGVGHLLLVKINPPSNAYEVSSLAYGHIGPYVLIVHRFILEQLS